jgi:hypothetical protein
MVLASAPALAPVSVLPLVLPLKVLDTVRNQSISQHCMLSQYRIF